MNEGQRDRMSPLERLLDFSTWGRSYERKGLSAVIMYLTNRLMECERKDIEREREAYQRRKAEERVLELYGPEAVRKFHELTSRRALQ